MLLVLLRRQQPVRTLATMANVGGSFSLSADEAKASFDLYALGFVPKSVSVKSVVPVLLPFCLKPMSGSSHNQMDCVYAGSRFSSNLTAAVKIDPFYWNKTTRMDMDAEANKSLLVDPVGRRAEGEKITLLPAYQFEFTTRGSPFPFVGFVGAQTGRTSGPRIFTWRDGLVEGFRFYFSRDSVVPAFIKLIAVLWYPILLQVVLGSVMTWAGFRALLSPKLAVKFDQFLTAAPPATWQSQALHSLMGSQFALYDPESDVFQLKAKQRAQEFLHDFINRTETGQARGPRQTEDFFRDLFRFQSTSARQQEFFRQMQEEHARQQQEFNQKHMGGRTEDEQFDRRFRRRRVVNEDGGYSDFFQQGQGKPEKDLYAVLGVSPQATQQELQRAYREQLLKFHPDHFKGDPAVAQKKTQDIIDAYRTLKQRRT
ncbi:hypothetical protein BASA81_003548 [Batrachochytrium salamandrivorans]|nr:hypothetical protein BASA81_003548 [Batrachochytrium salamandrivorans]